MAGDNWYTCTSAMTAEIRALGASPKGAGVDRGQRSWAGRHLFGGAHPRHLPAPRLREHCLFQEESEAACIAVCSRFPGGD